MAEEKKYNRYNEQKQSAYLDKQSNTNQINITGSNNQINITNEKVKEKEALKSNKSGEERAKCKNTKTWWELVKEKIVEKIVEKAVEIIIGFVATLGGISLLLNIIENNELGQKISISRFFDIKEINSDAINLANDSKVYVEQARKVNSVLEGKEEVNSNSSISEIIGNDVNYPESVQENSTNKTIITENSSSVYVIEWDEALSDKEFSKMISDNCVDKDVVENRLMPEIEKRLSERARKSTVAIYGSEELNKSEYGNHVKQANLLYNEYKSNKNITFEQKISLLNEAVKYRKLADQSKATVANRENLANDYYALGIEHYKQGLEEKAFDYFQKSIIWYLDSIAIGADGDYFCKERYYNIGMCFDNISTLNNISETDKKFSLFMAAAYYEEYYHTNSEKYENNLYLGTVYYKLMKLAEEEDAFYYYMKTKKHFSECVSSDNIPMDKVASIYEYLSDAVAYCILNIDSQYYFDGITKTDLQEQKEYYDMQKENYEKTEE